MKISTPRAAVLSIDRRRVLTSRVRQWLKLQRAAGCLQHGDETAHQAADQDQPGDGLVHHHRQRDIGQLADEVVGLQQDQSREDADGQGLEGAMGGDGHDQHNQRGYQADPAMIAAGTVCQRQADHGGQYADHQQQGTSRAAPQRQGRCEGVGRLAHARPPSARKDGRLAIVEAIQVVVVILPVPLGE
ncbi:hypothetical protein [Halomonas elongata]|uniref:hypothetical protein n=1 Tax=Halomonas elongata TaxID=2746 RepID=UPI0023AFAE18|nr:hypothetical protein [Halomonas elongata]